MTTPAVIPAINNQASQDTAQAPDVVLHHKLQQLESSDFFKNLTPQKKIGAYKVIYNKYVIPFNQAKGANIGFFDFVKGRTKEGSKTYISDNTSKVEKVLGGLTTVGVDTINGIYERALKQDPSIKHNLKWEDTVRRNNQWDQSHYSDSFKDSVLKGAGTLAAQVPLFELGEGLLEGVGLKTLLLGRAASLGWKARVGSRLLYNAANGYLIGKFTNDDPYQSALGFALGSEFISSTLKPFEQFYSKIMATGGSKLAGQVIEHGIQSVANKDVAATVSPAAAALAGSPKQKITAATVRMLNDLVGEGGWAKASDAAKKTAIEKLAKVAPEISDQLSVISSNIGMAKEAADITTQRKSSPLFNSVMTKMEQASKQPAAQSVQEYATQKAAFQAVKDGQVKIVPGAASAKSLEFEDNFVKKVNDQLARIGFGKDKIIWEDRGHKLLFYLNLLMEDTHKFGPSKERNKMFERLLQDLNQRYPERTLPELMQMSDNVWKKIEDLTKAGIRKPGEPVRFFRQSSIGLKQSPLSHEIKLLQDAAKDDAVKEEIQWPAAYKDAPKTLSSAGGGGANYSQAQLDELKKRNNIK